MNDTVATRSCYKTSSARACAACFFCRSASPTSRCDPWYLAAVLLCAVEPCLHCSVYAQLSRIHSYAELALRSGVPCSCANTYDYLLSCILSRPRVAPPAVHATLPSPCGFESAFVCPKLIAQPRNKLPACMGLIFLCFIRAHPAGCEHLAHAVLLLRHLHGVHLARPVSLIRHA